MKQVVIPLLLLCYAATISTAAAPQPIIEVHASIADGMLYPTPQNYLYLRVFGDGRVNYEHRSQTDDSFVLHDRKLSDDELRSLRTFLNSSEIKHLQSKYEPAFPTIDHRTVVTIVIAHGNKPQSIEVLNYNVALGKRKGMYSQPLLDLMCRIERLRGNSSFQLTADGWCTTGPRS